MMMHTELAECSQSKFMNLKPLAEMNLLLVLSKILSLMMVPCTQECHLFTPGDTNVHELAGKTGLPCMRVCNGHQKLCYTHALL